MDFRHKRSRTATALIAVACLHAPNLAKAQDPLDLAELGASEPATAETCEAEQPAPVEYVLPTTGIVWTFPADATEAAAECAPPLPPAPVRPTAPNLFRMAALPIGNMPSLQKWERARAGGLANREGPWSEMLAQANEVTGGNPLEMVNTWVNWHVRYQDDAGADEWADALSTLERGAGDCEDFAMTKMALLSALGIPADDMFLVLLRDRRNSEHAVLAVRRNGGFYILDNRTDRLQAADEIADYTPVLSFSGEFAWLYGTRLE
jgi:predicted transglutaminase-like cysteine proteinase